ncbi:hypothetical protein Bca101_071669 [Brassica carinata]
MVCVIERNFQNKTKQNKSIWELVSSVGTKLNQSKTRSDRDSSRRTTRTVSYIYISVEDFREFPSPCR